VIDSLQRLSKQLAARRAPKVRSGPARGLRIGRAEASADYRDGSNELAVQTALADVLRPGDVFFDVGANVGFFAMLAARIVGPTGSAVAFEPVPANVAQVRANARRNQLDNVTVLELAVGATDGSATLSLAAHPGGAALASAAPPPDPIGSIDVAVASIDALVSAGRIPPPDVVKVDVEGAEEDVLRGMATTLREHRPVVLCEIDDRTQDALAEKRRATAGRLEQAGYEIRWLDPSYDGNDWFVEHFIATPGGGEA
jgi:FkbM family methyltransferase